MPGLGGTKSKLSDTHKGDGSKPPPASRENPGQFHPQSSPTEAKRPSHYQPPVDPSSQSPDSDTSVSASRTSLPKDIAKDSDQGVASAVENPFVLREPLEGLERELDKVRIRVLPRSSFQDSTLTSDATVRYRSSTSSRRRTRLRRRDRDRSPSLHMYTPPTPTHGSFRGRGSAAGSYFPAAGASSPITSSYFPSTSSFHSPSFDVDVGSPRIGRYQRKIPITKIGLFVDEGGYREYYEVSWYSGYTWDRLQKRIIRKLARHEYLVGGRRVEFTYRDHNRRDRRIVGDADIAVVLGSPSPEIWVGFSV